MKFWTFFLFLTMISLASAQVEIGEIVEIEGVSIDRPPETTTTISSNVSFNETWVEDNFLRNNGDTGNGDYTFNGDIGQDGYLNVSRTIIGDQPTAEITDQFGNGVQFRPNFAGVSFYNGFVSLGSRNFVLGTGTEYFEFLNSGIISWNTIPASGTLLRGDNLQVLLTATINYLDADDIYSDRLNVSIANITSITSKQIDTDTLNVDLTTTTAGLTVTSDAYIERASVKEWDEGLTFSMSESNRVSGTSIQYLVDGQVSAGINRGLALARDGWVQSIGCISKLSSGSANWQNFTCQIVEGGNPTGAEVHIVQTTTGNRLNYSEFGVGQYNFTGQNLGGKPIACVRGEADLSITHEVKCNYILQFYDE